MRESELRESFRSAHASQQSQLREMTKHQPRSAALGISTANNPDAQHLR